MELFKIFRRTRKDREPQQVDNKRKFELSELNVELAQNRTRGIIQDFLNHAKIGREGIKVTVSDPNYGDTKNEGEIPRITFDVIIEGRGKKLVIPGLRLHYIETNYWSDERIQAPELTDDQKRMIGETFMEPDQGDK